MVLHSVLELLLSFPPDQLKYLFLFLLSFPLAVCFRQLLHHGHTSNTVRLLYQAILGLAFSLFCFEVWETLAILTVVIVAYFMLCFIPPHVLHWCTMVYALLCVVCAHCYYVSTKYGSWEMNATGPLMIMVQKMTYVAFEFMDGTVRADEELNEDQRKQKIETRPSFLEYISYNFSFVTFLAGPSCSFKDYIDYIAGDNMIPLDNPNQYAKAKEHNREPSPLIPALTKAGQAFTCLTVYCVLSSYVNKEVLIGDEYWLLKRFVLANVFMTGHRCMYYFSFRICEAICNASGLGFHGYDSKGVAQWDLVCNIGIMKVEMGTNMRDVISNWHMMSALWLRRCVYERCSFYPTAFTFLVSAVWHGLYPGYYISFFMFFLGIEAARKVRKQCRHYFLENSSVKLFYDILTTLSTCVWREWSGAPAVFLTFSDTLKIYSNFYFSPLIVCLLLILFVPSKTKKSHTN